MAAFLANVGVNSAHTARSPLFDDGTFHLLPIPERHAWCPPMLRLKDVAGARPFAPAAWLDRAVHLDPDLASDRPTYGDNCRRAGRAFSLRRAQLGDLIVFLSRLEDASGTAGFHLVGALDVDRVLPDVTRDPGPGWWDDNAHVRRARASGEWDAFWVFKGGWRSGFLKTAVPFTRHELTEVFDDALTWPPHRTELQTIGSYTRAVRRVEGTGEEWLRTACRS